MTTQVDPSSKTTKVKEVEYIDFGPFDQDTFKKCAGGTDKDRAEPATPIDQANLTPEKILRKEEMSFWNELACALFLAYGVPNCVFMIPLTAFIVGKFVLGNVSLAFTVVAVLLLPLALLPQEFVPSCLQSWMAVQLTKYFSFKLVMEDRPPSMEDESYRPRIMVAPPHGVFPYGNILSIIMYPLVCGYPFRALTASSALRPPIFKQIMKGIGCVAASRHVARGMLDSGHSIGISTGGVAEVFETNQDDEVILLRERIGLIKLAIRTGSDLIPSYLFGNTKLLSCWAGEGIPYAKSILQSISRKIGFATIIIYGRLGLPIPRRTVIFGVMGKPIRTDHMMKCEEPTAEQIKEIQDKLLKEMEDIFDRYKALYGWQDKKLIIK